MPKTQVPAQFKVGSVAVHANAKPDAYDLRDLEYRAILRPLSPVVDARPANGAFEVLTQKGESCTGHAIAAVINTVLARQADELKLPPPGAVSPYMLYKMARRYDEFLGDADRGSSLRGAFKGWLRHGVALDTQWHDLARRERTTDLRANPDLDNPAFIAACRERPLGAYYRVNAYRLDDMQSAINELHAIAVSAAIHRGWETPVRVTPPGGKPLMVIQRARDPEPAGGHAFCIVGYNQIGFLVQNSWGEEWGDGGFATLLYDDWLASAYDAWVCRPGVPSTPLVAPSITSKMTTSGDIVLSGGPNLTLLRKYVVNTGNDGRLSTTGKFVSNPAQLDEIFVNMDQKHAAWQAEATAAGDHEDRHVVLYAHGGVIDETTGLGIAQQQLGWWLRNHVYPINFCWESGAVETIGDALGDLVQPHFPFGGIRFDFEEHADRLVEWAARKFAAGLWREMKDNAIAASALAGKGDIRGGSEIARRLENYRAEHPDLKIHLAGHSAGTIFLSALVGRLSDQNVPIESVAFMGGAATNALVAERVLPAFQVRPNRGTIKRFTTFNLSEKSEQDDTCALGDKAWYHKSLLYLVARGLEPDPLPGKGFVPVVGLQLGLGEMIDGTRTMAQAITDPDDACDGKIVIAPAPATAEIHSDAHGHADFDNDSATMTSILLRMLDVAGPPAGPYRQDLPVPDLPEAAPTQAPEGMDTHVLVATTVSNHRPAGPDDDIVVATAAVFGGEPVGALLGAAPPPQPPAATLPQIQIPSEASISPKTSGSPAFDMLAALGYTFADPAHPDDHTTGNGSSNGNRGRAGTPSAGAGRRRARASDAGAPRAGRGRGGKDVPR